MTSPTGSPCVTKVCLSFLEVAVKVTELITCTPNHFESAPIRIRNTFPMYRLQSLYGCGAMNVLAIPGVKRRQFAGVPDIGETLYYFFHFHIHV